MSSKFRSEIRRYWIYCILDEIKETVYIGKSYAKNPKSNYYAHLRGEYARTKDAYADADITQPDFFILEALYCTGRVGFKHILAWYTYFRAHNFTTLTEDNVEYMMDNMSSDTNEIYDEVCAPYTLSTVLSREVHAPIAPQAASGKPKKEKDGTDTLKQLNIRVKPCIAQSFRAFCSERNLSQSNGLRLLLLTEDYNARELVMRSFLQEVNEKNAEIACLEEKCKELTELQKENETWVQYQRKEWTRIAKEIVGYVIAHSNLASPHLRTSLKSCSIKGTEGHRLFQLHQYPSSGGCYEVTITGLVRGYSRRKQDVEQYDPLFVCASMADGTLLKMRYYPKADYIGVHPAKWDLTYWGEQWLLCCIIAKDGAADLICAVPMNKFGCMPTLTQQGSHFLHELQIEHKTSNLDSIIADVRSRHK